MRRETNLAGTQATSCSYVATKNAARVVGAGVGEFASADESANAYARSRANARFDGLRIENVANVGDRSYFLPRTNNFQRTVRGKKVTMGELTALDGARVYTVFLAPSSKAKARDTMRLVISN